MKYRIAGCLCAWLGAVATVALLAGCASSGGAVTPSAGQAQEAAQKRAETDVLNRQLAAVAQQSAVVTPSVTEEYRVGAGDVLDIDVFQVEELSDLTERVNGRGGIILPLLGEIDVGGRTTPEIEATLVRHLDKYLHDPQVSVYVTEYRSQQITVMGAVNRPDVFSVQRPRTVLELLSMSGGLTETASDKIYVQTVAPDPDTGAPAPHSVVIDLRQLVQSGQPEHNLVLRGGDSLYVPEAGVVFVEGAVVKPGAYALERDTTVLKAIAMAGGPKFESKQSQIQLFRQNGTPEGEVKTVDLNAVRDMRAIDVALQDGDVVVVRSDAFKKGFAGFWRGFSGIFGIGYGIY